MVTNWYHYCKKNSNFIFASLSSYLDKDVFFIHNCKNAQTLSVLFFRLSCANFLPVYKQALLFLHLAVKIDIYDG